MADRLIRIEYSGGTGHHRLARAATLEGALRASVIRIAHGQYHEAHIYDDRFLEQKKPSLSVVKVSHGINTEWARTPKWKDQV